MLWGNVQVERLKADIGAMDREQRRMAGLERWRRAFKPVAQALEVSQAAETHLIPAHFNIPGSHSGPPHHPRHSG